MEYCEGGCLKHLLEKKKKEIEIGRQREISYQTVDNAETNAIEVVPEPEQDHDTNNIDTNQLVAWSYQLAMGMGFLAEQKIIHGDLAARNILLDGDYNVKIADFGKSHLLDYSNSYINIEGPQPQLWMAPEALEVRQVRHSGDVRRCFRFSYADGQYCI